ncbi:MAG TPA: hypothetical protein VNP97_14780 [Microbacterium sp.]|nr:hypothetical protein [Microbacterium sp.]
MAEPPTTDAVPLRYRSALDATDVSERTLQRRVKAGLLSRVRAGVYADPIELEMAEQRRREFTRIAAVVGTRRERVVLSHESAATVWGLPRIGPAPESVDLIDAKLTRPRSLNGVRWRRTPFDPAEVVEHNGYLVTGLLQTVADLACERGFVSAVAALDAATAPYVRGAGFVTIRGAERAAVSERLREFGRRRGVRAADRAIEFSDPRAESPGESLSRARMHLLGFPPPDLQVEFDRADGRVDRVDFDWPEYAVFGEFHGDLKYLDARYRGGRTAEQVLLDERKRDRMISGRHRRHGAHWDWSIAIHPRQLASVLADAGLPRTTPPPRL